MYTLKKSLGQHFLKNESIAERIVAALEDCGCKQVLEVGPGAGALTKYLLQLSNINFKAVELDEEKVNYLLSVYPNLKEKIIHQNFLELEKPFEGKFCVIGNFPYNISTEILFKIISWKEDVQCMIGMFQKEVAQRIAATEGNKVYGVTSVLTQAYFRVEYLFEVSENSFDPPPKVKSAVIRMTPVEKPAMKDESSFSALVKAAFNQRRKTLRNAVRSFFDNDTLSEEIFNKRAEQLKVEDFAALTFKIRS